MIRIRIPHVAALFPLVLLLGCTATAAAEVATRASPAGIAAQCRAAPDPARPQFIVGYGSLMQDESRKRTSPRTGAAHPIELAGYRRGWFEQGRSVGFGTTYLGVVEDRRGRFNAVTYAVDLAELSATDAREASYCRASVAATEVNTLEPSFRLPANAQAWIYVSDPRTVAAPDATHPIVESYVDIFVSGCLEQEERFALPGFARACLATTSAWSEHWVNDRIYPRRPFIYQPRAGEIDRLLSANLGRYFGAIRIEAAN